MRLDKFSSASFNRGATPFKEALWVAVSAIFVASWIPGSKWRQKVLTFFGAKIGTGVVLKPGIRVKFPWRLAIGDHSWIGESVWIDNLAEVSIGSHVCISQGVYICTGSHDWSKETFDLIVKKIRFCDHTWIGARAVIAPGTVVGDGAVLALGAIGSGQLDPWTIHYGMMNPKKFTRVQRV